MYMRLGFAVAIHVDPDVLLVDEVLAVGDEGFTHKCLDKFAEFRRRGKTILLVTHSLGLVERFCDEALWLDAAGVKGDGDPEARRRRLLTDGRGGRRAAAGGDDARARCDGGRGAPVAGRTGDGRPPATRSRPRRSDDMFQATEGRWGSREVEITDVALLGRRRRSRRSCSTPATDGGPHEACARRSRSTTSCSASACSTPTASAATAPTPISKR